MNQYIQYKCKKCGKEYRILSQWGDLRPKRCTGKRCGARFDRDKTLLEVRLPKKSETESQKTPKTETTKTRKNKPQEHKSTE